MRVRILFCLLLFMSGILGCSSDDIPQALSEPFVSTKVQLGTNTTPPLASAISPGQVTFNLSVAFTLSELDNANRQNLFLFTDFFALDGNGNFAGDIGFPPDAGEPVTSASNILNRSFTFNIPANIGFVRVRLQVENLVTGDFLFFDFDWPVQ